MTISRLLVIALAAVGAASAAESPVVQAAARAEKKAALAPPPLAMEFRLRAAVALHERYPAQSRRLLDSTLGELRGGWDQAMAFSVIQALVELSPKDAVAIGPYLRVWFSEALVDELVRTKHPAEAMALFRETAARLAEPLAFRDALWLARSAPPEAAAESCERVIRAASAPDYGKDGKTPATATFQFGQTTFVTDNTRDTLLLLAGTRLRTVAPDRFEKFKDAFARWKIEDPAAVRNITPPAAEPAPPEWAAISERIRTMRGLPTDADRARLTTDLVREIRALPAGPYRIMLFFSLCDRATGEGDPGKEALGAVASAMDAAMKDYPAGAFGDYYILLAKLVRYEHLPVPPGAALDAALALLELREQIQQENGFTVTGLDGQTYTLAGLNGRVVLLNFWATGSSLCRKEMPDMEKLYHRYQQKGLTVIAVSYEDRARVEQFLAKNSYSFPIALDPDRKVNTAFSVEGVPKSFIFDREGRLAAQTIHMRTESRLLELLKLAGLE